MRQKAKAIVGGCIISIILGVLAFDLPKLYSTVLYPDDLHYWASGAFWAGYDWSGMMWHNMYYSYGFGFLLAPFFAFTDNGIILFRLGILLNYILRIAGYWLLVKIGRTMFQEAPKIRVYLVCFLACMFPAWLLQVNSGLSEGVIYFLFILMIFLLIGLEKAHSLFKSLLLGFLTVYVYTVHQRMLAVTIAAAVTMAVMYFVRKIPLKCFIDYILMVLFTVCAHQVIKPVYQDYLYINYSTIDYDRARELHGVLCGIWVKAVAIYFLLAILLYLIHRKNLVEWVKRHLLVLVLDGMILLILFILFSISLKRGSESLNNDFGVVLSKTETNLSGGQLLTYLRTVLGHYFYIFSASGGMAVYTILCGCVDALRAIKIRKCQNSEILGIFLGISAILMLGVSALFMSGAYGERIDTRIYGRYCEFLVPVLLVIGILKIGKEGIRWKELLAVVLLFAVSAYSVYGYFKQGEMFGFFTDFRFLSTSSPSLYWEYSQNINGTLLAFGIGIVLLAVFMTMSYSESRIIWLSLLIMTGILFWKQGKDALNAYIVPLQELQNQGNVIAELIETQYEDFDCYFVRDVDASFESIRCSGYFQLRLPKTHMRTVRSDQIAGLQNHSIVICYIEDTDVIAVLEDAGYKMLKGCATSISFIKGEKMTLAGDGTQKKPYLIQNREDLIWFRDAVNSGEHFSDKYFRQTADIDLKGMEWEPIGLFGTDYYFAGYYDGNGHCIENLYIAREENCAFFALLAGTVANFGIESGSVEGICAAGIAGHSYGEDAKVVNCYNKADITGSYRAGGIVDNFRGYVCNCVNLGKVEAGITGEISAYDVVKAVYCYSITDNRFVKDTFTGWEYKNGIIIPDIPETVLTVNQLNRNAFWFKQDISVSLGKLCYWRYEDGEVLFAEDSPYSDWKYVRTLFLMKAAGFACLIAAGSILFWILIIRTECYKSIQMAISAGRRKWRGLMIKTKKPEKAQIEDRM